MPVPRTSRTIAEYRILQADGAPLPGWLERLSNETLMGERPANIDTISLKVVIIYSDGTSETKSVASETMSGEIKPIAEIRAEQVLPFTHQFSSAPSVPAEAIDDLAALLAPGIKALDAAE